MHENGDRSGLKRPVPSPPSPVRARTAKATRRPSPRSLPPLAVPIDTVVIEHGDTASSPPGVGTFGSRSVISGGGALVVMADRIVEKAKRIAAHQLEAAPDDVQLLSGRFVVAGSPGIARSAGRRLRQRAHGRGGALSPGEEMGLEETVYFRPKEAAWGHGTYVAVVQIDRDGRREPGAAHRSRRLRHDHQSAIGGGPNRGRDRPGAWPGVSRKSRI